MELLIEKIHPITKISTVKGASFKRAIYKIKGKFYVRGNHSYHAETFEGKQYSEVTPINIGKGNEWYI